MAEFLSPKLTMPDGETLIEVRAILAIDKMGVMGYDNRLIFNNPDDLQNFKTKTIGKVVVMGRKTFESIGTLLPGRQTVIVAHDPEQYTQKVLKGIHCRRGTNTPRPVATDDLNRDLPTICDRYGSQKVWIAGGAEIYNQAGNSVGTWVVTEYNVDLESYETDRDDDCVGVKLGFLPADYDTTKLSIFNRSLLQQASINVLETGRFNGVRSVVKSYNRMGRLPYSRTNPSGIRGKSFQEIEDINREVYRLPQDRPETSIHDHPTLY